MKHFNVILILSLVGAGAGKFPGVSSGKQKGQKVTTTTEQPKYEPEVDVELQNRCQIKHYKSILHGKALVSSISLDRDSAEECCKSQPGFDYLLSLDDDYSANIFANSHKVKSPSNGAYNFAVNEPYHAYTNKDSSGNYLFAQGKKIHRRLMSKDAYLSHLKPGDCLFAVVESEAGERVTRYVTGACHCIRPFICMKFGAEETYNVTCKVDQSPNLEAKRQTPSELQKFDFSQQNRHLAKMSIRSDIDGWAPPVTNPIRGYKLVERTFEIFREIVPVSVLPKGFTSKVMVLFADLNGRYGPQDKTDFISEESFDRIDKLLTNCSKNLPKIPYVFNDCETQILGTFCDKDNITIKYGCPKSGYCYNPFTTDPLLYVAQNVFQTVRNLCFPTFKMNSIVLFHRWQLAINDCFTEMVQDRWNFQVEPLNYWDRMLGTHFDEKVRVTDAVTMAVIEKSQPWSMTYPRGEPPNVRMPGF